jgi:hypothetical protein
MMKLSEIKLKQENELVMTERERMGQVQPC